MNQIGMRELTHHTAHVMQRVRAGETLLVTDHGKPVAHLVPAEVTEDAVLAQLAARGAYRPPLYQTEFDPPPDTGDASLNLSDVLIAMRDEEGS